MWIARLFACTCILIIFKLAIFLQSQHFQLPLTSWFFGCCCHVAISVDTTAWKECHLRSWVRIPPVAWIFVCCECRVLSGRGLCDELITRLEESYRLWCVVVCDVETSRTGAPYIYIYIYTHDISSLRVKLVGASRKQ